VDLRAIFTTRDGFSAGGVGSDPQQNQPDPPLDQRIPQIDCDFKDTDSDCKCAELIDETNLYRKVIVTLIQLVIRWLHPLQ
jgi:hypothetical protein